MDNYNLVSDLLASWQLWLRSQRKSESTVDNYQQGVKSFLRWCADHGEEPAIDKTLVQRWVVDMLESGANPSTARIRQFAMMSYAKWLYNEREIDTNPLDHMTMVKLDTKVVQYLSDSELSDLIKACRGDALADRRDEALIRFMAETGARAREVTSLEMADIDLDSRTAIIRRGKGGKGRLVSFSPQCAAAIDRYLRKRRSRAAQGCTALWVNKIGTPMSYMTLYADLRKRAATAGVVLHPHLFRHTAATRWLRAGGTESGLMAMAGWSSRSMIDRYTRASASERAVEESQRLGLGGGF